MDVVTAQYAGLDSLHDNELLPAIKWVYDILITPDRGLPHQQTAGRRLAIVVLGVNQRSPEGFAALVPELTRVLGSIGPGEMVVVTSF